MAIASVSSICFKVADSGIVTDISGSPVARVTSWSSSWFDDWTSLLDEPPGVQPEGLRCLAMVDLILFVIEIATRLRIASIVGLRGIYFISEVTVRS